MTLPLPQTKTFVFPLSANPTQNDAEINEWKKSIMKKGDQVCPSPPTLTTTNSDIIYVYTYSIPFEVPNPEPKKKK